MNKWLTLPGLAGVRRGLRPAKKLPTYCAGWRKNTNRKPLSSIAAKCLTSAKKMRPPSCRGPQLAASFVSEFGPTRQLVQHSDMSGVGAKPEAAVVRFTRLAARAFELLRQSKENTMI